MFNRKTYQEYNETLEELKFDLQQVEQEIDEEWFLIKILL